jgi:hypothetical protein
MLVLLMGRVDQPVLKFPVYAANLLQSAILLTSSSLIIIYSLFRGKHHIRSRQSRQNRVSHYSYVQAPKTDRA